MSRARTACAAIASTTLAIAFAPHVHADPLGVDDTRSSALDVNLARGWGIVVDPDDEPKRSPTGILYPRFPIEPEARAEKGGVTYRGEVDVGGSWSSGDTGNYFFRRYTDVGNGVYVGYFSVAAEDESAARYLEGYGGEVGRTDQFYSVTFGRYNAWEVQAFFDEIPTTYSTTYRSLWNGLGSGSLTLASLTPGGSPSSEQTQANLQGALATTPGSTVGIKRKTAGVRIDGYLGENWKLYASYANQNRQGTKPFGMVFGGGDGGGNVDITESIDYDTHDVVAGLEYGDVVSTFNLQFAASLFRNNIDTMSVENPLTISTFGIAGVPPTTFKSARYDLEPDNDFYKVKAEYARALPSLWNGRLIASLAWTRSRQNDSLIAPTTLPLTGGSINGVPTANVWNTTAALAQQTADAQIDSTLANVRLVLNPTPALALIGKVRYYETDNSTAYTACNPLTGQWGRLLNDGSGTSIVDAPAYLAAGCNLAAVQALNVAPSTGNIPIRSVPFDYRQTVYNVTAEYRLAPKSSMTASLEEETYDRSNRERDRTWEWKAKIGYTNRALRDAVLLLSYEYDNRRGSAYVANAYDAYYSSALGPIPTTPGTDMSGWIQASDAFRKYDLADRDRNIVKARVNWTGIPSLDAGLTVQYNGVRYPDSAYGRNGNDSQTSLSLSLGYAPDAPWGLYGSYTWQAGEMNQAGLPGFGCLMGSTYYFFSNGDVNTTGTVPEGASLIGSTQVTPANWQQVCRTPSALSPLFPTSFSWTNQQRSTNQTLTIGGHYDFGRARLDAAYTYVNGRTRTSYTYNAAAYELAPEQVALIGNGMPDGVFIQSVFDAGLLVPLGNDVAVRLFYRYENGRISDWHYDGVLQNPVPATTAAYLDYGPQSYHASITGVFLRYRF